MSSGSPSRRARNEQRTTAEVVTFVISALLLLALVVAIVAVDVARGDARVRIEVEPRFREAYEHRGHWYLPVAVENVGDEPTAAVVVEVELAVAGAAPEVAELEWSFLAAGEQATGTATFTERPTVDAVEAFARSVTDP